MGKIEDIIAKDKIKTCEREMFESICSRIDREQQNRLPFAVGLSVKLACCLVILLSAVNFIAFENNEEVQTVDGYDNEEYHIFAKENYIDILSEYYPEELMKGK